MRNIRMKNPNGKYYQIPSKSQYWVLGIERKGGEKK